MSSGLRIAVYHNLPPGGAKRALFEMVCRLTKKHHVDLFTLSSAENTFCDVRPFVENTFVYAFDAWSPEVFKSPFGRFRKGVELGNLLRLRELSKEISRQIDQGVYDVAFVHHCRFTQSPSVLEFLETPAIYYCQEPVRWMYEPAVSRPYHSGRRSLDGLDILRKSYVAILRRIDQINTKKANLVLANSYYSRESIYRIYGVNARVCYLGVDAEHFKPLESQKENIVLAAGSVTPAKGNELVVEGLAFVPEKIRPMMVLACHEGNSEEKEFLVDLAAERSVKLQFRDLGDNGRLVKLYSAAKMTAYTPYLEPLGLVPLESMACCTPVVGVREGGVRETVVHGQTGILVDRDPEEFGGAVQNLLESDELARRYGMQGRDYVLENWSWDKTVRQAEGHLLQIAESHR